MITSSERGVDDGSSIYFPMQNSYNMFFIHNIDANSTAAAGDFLLIFCVFTSSNSLKENCTNKKHKIDVINHIN